MQAMNLIKSMNLIKTPPLQIHGFYNAAKGAGLTSPKHILKGAQYSFCSSQKLIGSLNRSLGLNKREVMRSHDHEGTTTALFTFPDPMAWSRQPEST